MECVTPSYAITRWWSDYTHTHLPDIICQIHLDRINVWTRLKTNNYGRLAEIRRGKKKERKKIETIGQKFNGLPYYIGRPIT